MYTLYKFHFLNGISEINQLFDDILIIWPAPVYLKGVIWRDFKFARCVCVCVREREREGREREREGRRGRHGHTTAACLQIHTSIITVSVTRLCSPLGLELMVKLRTLLTVFTFILKAKSLDYGKGRYISDSCLWCSANHNALGQLANQSRLRLSEGGTL